MLIQPVSFRWIHFVFLAPRDVVLDCISMGRVEDAAVDLTHGRD
jgi:hypothetical protein